MSLSRRWFAVVWTLQSLQVAYCCVNNGDFDCSRKWYFWFGIFWGFIILLVGSITFYNKQCRGNKVACGAAGRRRSRRNQKKRHPESVTSSTTSQATAVTILPANQVIVPMSQPHDQQKQSQQQQQQQQKNQQHLHVGVRPDSRMNHSTGLLSTTTSEQRSQTPRTAHPTPPS
ncbi:hypothetical protein RRG08_051251 [Elysia crispata]|uniref:Uncharacterized protein n=1 Tax=Elysia crispata TaxID=231223 RepID=A0AAE1DTC1_9GAST|nr:hypothetical protein RRG08_051251 [Elysia crispata]